ncbi:MAG TPA: hypothetical protein VEL76_37765, partial [Gemmataceae bacterium]|nr:hypothetical protein [Gemmataceae bacterium]
MLRKRRLWTVASVTGILFAITLFLPPSTAVGQLGKKKKGPLIEQPPPPVVNETNPATQNSGIRPNENDDYQRLIDVARDYTLGRAWQPAVRALQKILDATEAPSALIRHTDPVTGEERVRRASVRFEANNLLGSMPQEGLNAYELESGAKARTRLEEAKRKGDREMLADVAMRYMHTKAGIEANELRATAALDRGEFHDAALRFRQLIDRADARTKISDLTLFKTALAYRRAGDTANADQMWKLLEPRLRDAGGLRVANETYPTARLRAMLEKIPAAPPPNPHDWPWVGGNLQRSAQAKGSPPLLDEVLWMRKTVMDKSDEGGEVDRGQEAKIWIDEAVRTIRSRGLPILPGFFPIAANGRLIYRTYNGISAVTLHPILENGKVVAKPGEIDWKSTEFFGALAPLLSDPNLRLSADPWLRQVYMQSGFINLVYENSAVGTLSTDNRLVYTVDDLAVPAPPAYRAAHVWNSPQVADKIKPLVLGNVLQAFELESGKIAFQLGKLDGNDPFSGSHFLGAPLPVSGRLYILNEKNDGQLRLFCIEPRAERHPGGIRWNPVIIEPTQNLGTVLEHHRIDKDIARRANTVHLAYGEGILVCPTNAGEILGVDLMSRALAWSYPYRQTPPNPLSMQTNPQFQFQPPQRPTALTYANWKVSPPIIADGKVVFTAPDSVSVHCISLRDGTPIWSVRQQDNDLFLGGVVDGKVLVVGKNSCRAYPLASKEPTPSPLWSVTWNNDMPSGQGVASNNIYYLPLSKGEILAVDVTRGIIKAHNRATNAKSPPGNLVFYEGAVLSQNIDEVVAYPQLTAKVEQAVAAVNADPNNLDKLTSRGELLLRDGQVQKAVDDLRTVWKKNPQGPLQARVRQAYYDALTDLLRIDFKGVREKYLSEYEELCKVPENAQEQEQRQARFLQILGEGLESEGNLVEAFSAYRKFGALPLFREQGIPSTDDPAQKIPSTVWLRGRVMTMLAKVPPEQRAPLENKIGEEWKAVEAKGDLEAIRSFVGMFDTPFQVGREARLRLADTIIEKKNAASYLEAELNLLQLRVPGLKEDPKVGGRALEALARLEISKSKAESMRLAMAYYK